MIDAENAVLGRLARDVAKQALQGRKIDIVNSEKAIILGNRVDIIEKYRAKRARGGTGLKGPFFSSDPEKILKRTIRGMINYKEGRGRLAFKRVKCFVGIPKELEGKKIIKAGRGKTGISLDKISKTLKGK